MKNKITKLILVFALLLLPFGTAKALDTKAGDSIYVPKEEIISGNFYAAGNTITVDGNISGDLIAVAQTITVNGNVEGDIIVAAQNITINGNVDGNIRVAGESISLNGQVTRNVNAFGRNIILGNNNQIGWDIFAMADSLESRGNIEGGLAGSFGHALISGKIGKNINIKMFESGTDGILIISSEATINNGVVYTAKKTAQISEKAAVNGGVEQKVPQTKETNTFAAWLWPEIYSIFCALVVGLVLVFIGKNVTLKILKKIDNKPFHALLQGLILMFVLPIIAFLLLFTLIGIPLALIICAWWLIAIYVARIFTAILIGQIILKNIIKNKKNDPKLIWCLILGVIICWLLFAIPYVGWIFCLIAIWFGLGGFLSYASNQLRHI